MLNRIVIAVDGSASSEHALELGAEIAKESGARVTLVAVVPLHPVYFGGPGLSQPILDDEKKFYRDTLSKMQTKARSLGAREVSTELLEGLVVQTLLDFLEVDPPDLMVLGCRGVSATRALLLGSVSEAMVHHAPCAVLVDRSRPRRAGRAAPSRSA
jgi:maltose/moltooligosaccharide transporter